LPPGRAAQSIAHTEQQQQKQPHRPSSWHRKSTYSKCLTMMTTTRPTHPRAIAITKARQL
jgi:hypothetical protein